MLAVYYLVAYCWGMENVTTLNKKVINAGQLVKSKLDIHLNGLTTWRVLEVNTGLSGRKIYFCKASHDTKMSYGFDKIKRDFKESEIELVA